MASSGAHGQDDIEHTRRYKTPYSARHPIPTVAKYRAEKESRQQDALRRDDDGSHRGDELFDDGQADGADDKETHGQDGQNENGGGNDGENETPADTSQVDAGASDVKARRKEMKKSQKKNSGGKKERARREVTDPVTHLPITIQDFTDEALKNTDHNDPPFGSTSRTATGMDGKRKSGDELSEEQKDMQQGHDFLVNRFPPPDFGALRQELVSINKQGISFALGGVALICVGSLALDKFIRKDGFWGDDGFHISTTLGCLVLLSFSLGGMAALVITTRDWISKKVNNVFEDEVWDAQRNQIKSDAAKHENETTAWLNSLIGSVWPLVNPDLFAGIADMLEDVMQASLPRFVRMVSVEDIGQGSESIRILGVRWLPTGAATKSVTEAGHLTDSGEDEVNLYD